MSHDVCAGVIWSICAGQNLKLAALKSDGFRLLDSRNLCKQRGRSAETPVHTKPRRIFHNFTLRETQKLRSACFSVSLRSPQASKGSTKRTT